MIQQGEPARLYFGLTEEQAIEITKREVNAVAFTANDRVVCDGRLMRGKPEWPAAMKLRYVKTVDELPRCAHQVPKDDSRSALRMCHKRTESEYELETTGWVCGNGHLYMWAHGEGDTLEGLYQDLGVLTGKVDPGHVPTGVVEYGEIEIVRMEYSRANHTEGKSIPVVEYRQKKTVYYADNVNEESYITDGAVLGYEKGSPNQPYATLMQDGSVVFADYTGSTQDRTQMINVTISLNGKTTTHTIGATQSKSDAVPVSDITLSVVGGDNNIYIGSSVKNSCVVNAVLHPTNATTQSLMWEVTEGAGKVNLIQSSNKCTVATTGSSTPGTVKIRAKAMDGSGVVSNEVTISLQTRSVSRTEYGNIAVGLEYKSMIPAAGGSVMPTLTYSQTNKKYYNDGSEETETINQTSGYSGVSIEYKKEGTEIGVVDTASGKVSVSEANTSTSTRIVCGVSVKVSINGKTGTGLIPYVGQKGKELNWYAGQLTATVAEFAAKSKDELVAASNGQSTSNKASNLIINNSIWFVMVPVGTTVKSAQYVAGGITSNFTAEDVVNSNVFKAVHGQIVIDGTTYNIYGNRNTALVGSNAAGQFVLN